MTKEQARQLYEDNKFALSVKFDMFEKNCFYFSAINAGIVRVELALQLSPDDIYWFKFNSDDDEGQNELYTITFDELLNKYTEVYIEELQSGKYDQWDSEIDNTIDK
jgi:hypothetical protein